MLAVRMDAGAERVAIMDLVPRQLALVLVRLDGRVDPPVSYPDEVIDLQIADILEETETASRMAATGNALIDAANMLESS